KPDFVFFGEGIPPDAYAAAFGAAEAAGLCLIVGSTGLVYPAAEIPRAVKRGGGMIIEVDPGQTEFTRTLTDIHVRLGAVEALEAIDAALG
ncbi:MAG TPA: RNA polymerase subunit sigma, partial [Rectinemataceae bacterium]|nr:RNA polymerase subunit sigma [Rectinemataceae bacterium]